MSEANEQATEAVHWTEQGSAQEGIVHALLAVQAELRTANLLAVWKTKGIARPEDVLPLRSAIRAQLDLDGEEKP